MFRSSQNSTHFRHDFPSLAAALASRAPRGGLADDDLDMFGGLGAAEAPWATQGLTPAVTVQVTLPKIAVPAKVGAYEELEPGLRGFGEKVERAGEANQPQKKKQKKDKQIFNRVMARIQQGPTNKLD